MGNILICDKKTTTSLQKQYPLFYDVYLKLTWMQNTIVADTRHVNTQCRRISICMCIRTLAKPLYCLATDSLWSWRQGAPLTYLSSKLILVLQAYETNLPSTSTYTSGLTITTGPIEFKIAFRQFVKMHSANFGIPSRLSTALQTRCREILFYCPIISWYCKVFHCLFSHCPIQPHSK